MDDPTERSSGLFNWASRAGAFVLVFLITSTTLLKISSVAISKLSLTIMIIIAFIPTIILPYFNFSRRMVLPLAKQLLGGAITFFILLILIFFLVNKFWVTESDYLPEDSWEIFAAMDFNDSLIKKDILICSRISGATMVEESIYRVNSEMITVAYNNNSSEEIPYNLKYIIRSLLKEELNFSVYHNDTQKSLTLP